MKPSDLFSIDPVLYGDEIVRAYDAYWDVELFIANDDEAPYSDLLNMSTDNRTCGVCGAITGTDSVGWIMGCTAPKCLDVREYLGINGLVHLRISNSNANKHRKAFLMNRLKKDFGGTPLSLIPPDERFGYLSRVMEERKRYEST